MGSMYNKETHMLIGVSSDEAMDTVIKQYMHGCRKDEIVMKELNRFKKYHSLENHNFHIKRYGFCIYCRENPGSKPLPSVTLKKYIEDLK